MAQPARRRESEPSSKRRKSRIESSPPATLKLKTVINWQSRTTTQDARVGPAKPCSAKPTAAEEATVVEFRQRTMLPLDDMLGHLLDYFPPLNRSALHRCLVRHGINQAPKSETATKHGKLDKTEMGYLHIE